jgi:uncharacterized repeat protein (TIGR03843 family)
LSDLLATGKIVLEGRVPWSSNYTFLVTLRRGEEQALAIYKPSRGERPLWDFPSQTLCRREVAAYRLSRALGWPAIPPVVLRRGPYGPGSLQTYIEADLQEHYFTVRDAPQYDEPLRCMALFDEMVNNADRKAGHVLKASDGQLWAIDHGLTFHEEHKLRTVIWDYAGQAIPATLLADLCCLQEALLSDETALCQELLSLITPQELAALRARLSALICGGVHPLPRDDWRNVPYPLV